MPELPELETVKRILEPQLKGRTIEQVSASLPKVIKEPDFDSFCRLTEQRKITEFLRRGKYLLIHLSDGGTIAIHLRMTGCLFLNASGNPLEKHTHAVFHLSGGEDLRFLDARRFGGIWYLGEAESSCNLKKLGPEPFSKEMSAQYLKTRCGKRKSAIKVCLIDQTVIAGIGNIYSDEILFQAKIRPNRAANTISEAEWDSLALWIPQTLFFFLEHNHITLEEYQKKKGRKYINHSLFQVYGRGGKPCYICGTRLQKKRIGGRSSVFCPICQPAD